MCDEIAARDLTHLQYEHKFMAGTSLLDNDLKDMATNTKTLMKSIKDAREKGRNLTMWFRG